LPALPSPTKTTLALIERTVRVGAAEARSASVLMSQMLMFQPPRVASAEPVGEKARPYPYRSCEIASSMVATHSQVSVRQSLTVPSCDLVARRRPSLEKVSAVTVSVWPTSFVPAVFSLVVSQTTTLPSSRAAPSRAERGAQARDVTRTSFSSASTGAPASCSHISTALSLSAAIAMYARWGDHASARTRPQ
jgi:hypothetical protein